MVGSSKPLGGPQAAPNQGKGSTDEHHRVAQWTPATLLNRQQRECLPLTIEANGEKDRGQET
jgi:hypothetical protein